jgi:hypothetical protein
MIKIQRLPVSAYFQNARTALPEGQWPYISHTVLRNARYVCAACGEHTAEHVHEEWEWDVTTGTQRLVALVPLCEPCHNATHLWFAAHQNRYAEALTRIMRVNNCTFTELRKEAAKEDMRIAGLDAVPTWTLDITMLDAYVAEFNSFYTHITEGWGDGTAVPQGAE